MPREFDALTQAVQTSGNAPRFERVKSTSDPSGDQRLVISGVCGSLTVGRFSDELRHYARCRLGDSAARLALLKSQIVDSESYVHTHADFEINNPWTGVEWIDKPTFEALYAIDDHMAVILT